MTPYVHAPASARSTSTGRAFVYVLPCHVEELLKIGFSRDPINRFETFHPRYFEVFDLARGFLIETDRVSEARDLERRLMHGLDAHNAPAPITIRPGAAGDTEWYRGVYAAAFDVATTTSAELGYELRTPLCDWLRQELERRADYLFEWSANSMAIVASESLDLRSDPVAAQFSQRLIDKVDAYAAANLSVSALVTNEFYAWYRSRTRLLPQA